MTPKTEAIEQCIKDAETMMRTIERGVVITEIPDLKPALELFAQARAELTALTERVAELERDSARLDEWYKDWCATVEGESIPIPEGYTVADILIYLYGEVAKQHMLSLGRIAELESVMRRLNLKGANTMSDHIRDTTKKVGLDRATITLDGRCYAQEIVASPANRRIIFDNFTLREAQEFVDRYNADIEQSDLVRRLAEALEKSSKFLDRIARCDYTFSNKDNQIGHYDAESGTEESYNGEACGLCEENTALIAEARGVTP